VPSRLWCHLSFEQRQVPDPKGPGFGTIQATKRQHQKVGAVPKKAVTKQQQELKVDAIRTPKGGARANQSRKVARLRARGPTSFCCACVVQPANPPILSLAAGPSAALLLLGNLIGNLIGERVVQLQPLWCVRTTFPTSFLTTHSRFPLSFITLSKLLTPLRTSSCSFFPALT